MKRYFLVSIFILSLVGASFAQTDSEVFFRFADKEVTKDEVMYVLNLPKDSKEDITIEAFNRALDYYLSIHDFKERGADTTKQFKRSLAAQTFNILKNVYATKNYKSVLNKFQVPYSSFDVVRDLVIPFDPIILRRIKELKEKEDTSFDTIVKYATAYDGASVRTRIIAPFDSNYSLNQVVSGLLKGVKIQSWIGPLKGMVGYHYFQLLKKQPNFGCYKMQLIFVFDREGRGEEDIYEAYKELQEGEDFRVVARKYSERYSMEKDSLTTYYYIPAISTNEVFVKHLEELQNNNSTISKPFFASKGWYILKKIAWEEYPSQQDLERETLRMIRKPSFFLDELKWKYKVEEFPYNFLSGKNEVIFLVAGKAYYEKDLDNYAKEYGYAVSTEVYDNYLSYLLVEKYKREADRHHYERLLNDFYFMSTVDSFILDRKKANDLFVKKLKQLVMKYKPVITNSKYVENNPIFEQ